MKRRYFAIFAVILMISTMPGCKETPPTPTGVKDPSRCIAKDFGEAYDLVQNKNIDDDRMIKLTGVANPKALLWRDSQSGKTYYITWIMETERKLFFMREVENGEQPGMTTKFAGYLRRWDALPKTRFDSVRNALKKKYNVDIIPEAAYVIDAQGKPEGCK